ncbi:hypothetical protein R1sor_025108 [Riccia sorocarpa]|uniref:Uncharacterized protein n=1 Tax=Riccia sorocarpa TaxID=122646 RepID=A0ABD3GAX6_9MARC
MQQECRGDEQVQVGELASLSTWRLDAAIVYWRWYKVDSVDDFATRGGTVELYPYLSAPCQFTPEEEDAMTLVCCHLRRVWQIGLENIPIGEGRRKLEVRSAERVRVEGSVKQQLLLPDDVLVDQCWDEQVCIGFRSVDVTREPPTSQDIA